MRLDPVYLAPRPEPPSMPTRRAFLLTGAAFLGGAAIGGACGYSMGASGANTDAPPAASRLEPSGDAELDELRRLAVEAPIDELMDKAVLFLGTRSSSYREDSLLYEGVGRIAQEILTNDRRQVSAVLVSAVLSAIRNGSPPSHLNLESLLRPLERQREALRQGK